MGDVEGVNISHIFDDLQEDAQTLLEKYKDEVSKLRVGALDIESIKEIKVDVYGSRMPLYQVATIMKQGATSIVITPWDKNAVKSIVDALTEQLKDIVPSVKGTSIFINMPPITAERKRELLKQVSKIAEQYRQKLRDIRNDAKKKIENLKKDKKISEDEYYKLIERLDKETRAYRQQIDDIYHRKEQQLLE